jgi:hypothetical protein
VDHGVDATDGGIESARLCKVGLHPSRPFGRITHLEDVTDNSEFNVVGILFKDCLQIIRSLRGADRSSDSVIFL